MTYTAYTAYVTCISTPPEPNKANTGMADIAWPGKLGAPIPPCLPPSKSAPVDIFPVSGLCSCLFIATHSTDTRAEGETTPDPKLQTPVQDPESNAMRTTLVHTYISGTESGGLLVGANRSVFEDSDSSISLPNQGNYANETQPDQGQAGIQTGHTRIVIKRGEPRQDRLSGPDDTFPHIPL